MNSEAGMAGIVQRALRFFGRRDQGRLVGDVVERVPDAPGSPARDRPPRRRRRRFRNVKRLSVINGGIHQRIDLRQEGLQDAQPPIGDRLCEKRLGGRIAELALRRPPP